MERGEAARGAQKEQGCACGAQIERPAVITAIYFDNPQDVTYPPI